MKIAVYSLPLAFRAMPSDGIWLVLVFMLIELKIHAIRVTDQLTSLFSKQRNFGVMLFKKLNSSVSEWTNSFHMCLCYVLLHTLLYFQKSWVVHGRATMSQPECQC